jgi:hypothetical protein
MKFSTAKLEIKKCDKRNNNIKSKLLKLNYKGEQRMNENGQNQHGNEVKDHITIKQEHKPYWRRVHHSWIFWFFLFLMFVSITYYIMSVNFAFAPQKIQTSSVK